VTGTLSKLLGLTAAPRRGTALATALGTATAICGVGLMATAGYLISRAAERPAVLSLTAAIVAVRFFGLAKPLCRYFERLTSHDLALRVLAGVRTRVYERIEPLAPGELAAYRRGDLLSRLVADVDALQDVRLRAVHPALVALATGAVSVAVAAAVLPSAALVLAAGLVLAGLAVPAVDAAWARRTAQREAPSRGELSAQILELAGGAPELVAYGCEEARLTQLAAADRGLVAHARRAAVADGAAEALQTVVAGATLVGVLALSIDAHAGGRLDRVLIAALGLLALATFDAVQPLARSARELVEAIAAGRRILELTERTPRIRDPERPAKLPEAPFTVALEDVSARYEPDEPLALEHATLRLEPGRRLALVGPSGVGKSTVANLLLRFVDPADGRVTLAGRDLCEYRQEDVRRAIAVAGQDAHLFSGSIRDNVRLARPDASDEEVAAALRQARVWDWIETLPDGLDTRVGEEGRELSGGQRQRIALARALLAGAPVLVLDEPTAHLDPATAETLMDDVFAAAGDRSVLLITHRPEGLGLVDEVHSLA
jgi:thiol reductant ABC exporter CydC subunit